MPATTAGFSEHMAPGLRAIIGTNLGGRESYYSALWNVETTDRNYEDYLAAAGLPVAGTKAELTPITSYDPLEGNTKRLTPAVTAIGFEVSEEAWEDDLYTGKGSALRDAGNGLADSLAERVELDAHDPFSSNGFDTLTVLPSNTDYVFDLTHAPVSGGEAGNQSNRAATDAALTLTSYRAMLTQFRKYKNDRGLRIPGFTKVKFLAVGPDLEHTALEIVGSTWRPDTANRVENVTKNATQVFCTPYIESTTAWFGMGMKHHFYFLWRWRPRMDNFDDRRSRAAVFVGYQRYIAKPVHWLGTYGSEGDGAI